MSKKQQVLDAIQNFILQREKSLKTRPILNNATEGKEIGEWTLTQLHIVALINEHPSQLNNTFLAEKLNLSKPAVTKAIKILIEKEIVVGKRKEGDKKSVYYTLTTDGRRLALIHEGLHQRAKERYDHLLNKFDEPELDTIIKFLNEWTNETIKE
ncbi:MarR family transcriptional regulator [Bacillus paramycoides]|uniref:MarR family transcriptional regulator n=1 Tax=Bacillus paramycoides TaxID=2026194 RepID=UPI003D01BBE7